MSRLVWLSCLLAFISGLILGMSWPCVGKILRIVSENTFLSSLKLLLFSSSFSFPLHHLFLLLLHLLLPLIPPVLFLYFLFLLSIFFLPPPLPPPEYSCLQLWLRMGSHLLLNELCLNGWSHDNDLHRSLFALDHQLHRHWCAMIFFITYFYLSLLSSSFWDSLSLQISDNSRN